MDKILFELRQTLRGFSARPLFAVMTVLTLTLGIGVTTILFSVLHGVLLKPLPFFEPQSIVRVFEIGADGSRSLGMADLNFADLRERNHSFEGLSHFHTGVESVISGTGESARVVIAMVSQDFPRVMGVQPVLGRLFRSDEHQTGAAPAALVSHAWWQEHMGGARDLAGRSLRFGGRLHTVIGVLPPGFDYPDGAHIWTPRELLEQNLSRTTLNGEVVGRLAADASLEQARADISGIARQLSAEYGDGIWMVDTAVVPLHEYMVGQTRPTLWLLFTAATLLLLIACANVANLLLARAAARQQKLAVRVALGASQRRLALHFLGESLLLTVTGGVLGAVAAYWGIELLSALPAGNLPRLAEIQVDGTVLIFVLVVSLLIAVLLGLLTSRMVPNDVVTALAASQRMTSTGAGSTRLRNSLVILQVAMTLMLLVGAALLGRSLLKLLDVDPGFRTDNVVIMNLSSPRPGEGELEKIRLANFYHELLTRLKAIPGIDQVGGVNSLPLASSGASGTFLVLNRPDEVTDFDSFDAVSKLPGRTGQAEFRVASEGYFRAMAIPLLRGRLFATTDTVDSAHVALVSESLAARQWPGEDPIGKLVQFGNMDGDMTPFTVIGVVGDVRETGLEAESRPTFFGYYRQRPLVTSSFTIVMHGLAESSAVIAQARRIVHDLNAEIPPEFQTIERLFAGATAERRFQLLLFSVFGVAALLLAMIGIYAVIAYEVSQRTREVGVRMAFGASSANIVRLVLWDGFLLTAIGLALGMAGAMVISRLMQSLLFGVSATDPFAFLFIPLLLLAIAMFASYLPVRQAARIEPIQALRDE